MTTGQSQFADKDHVIHMDLEVSISTKPRMNFEPQQINIAQQHLTLTEIK